MKPKIAIITLGVRDFEQSLAFYERLGFPLDHRQDDIAFFALEGTHLALYPRDKLAEDATVPPEGSGFCGITLAHQVASRESVDETFGLAVAAGARPIKQPQDVFWGGYSSYVADPDGYLWEICFNPYTDRT